MHVRFGIPNGSKINIKSNYRNEKLRSPFNVKGKQNGCCVNFDWSLNTKHKSQTAHAEHTHARTSIGDEVIAVNCSHRCIDNVLLNTVDLTRVCIFDIFFLIKSDDQFEMYHKISIELKQPAEHFHSEISVWNL